MALRQPCAVVGQAASLQTIEGAMEAHMRSADDCRRLAEECETLAAGERYGEFLLEAARIWPRLAALPTPLLPFADDAPRY